MPSAAMPPRFTLSVSPATSGIFASFATFTSASYADTTLLSVFV